MTNGDIFNMGCKLLQTMACIDLYIVPPSKIFVWEQPSATRHIATRHMATRPFLERISYGLGQRYHHLMWILVIVRVNSPIFQTTLRGPSDCWVVSNNNYQKAWATLSSFWCNLTCLGRHYHPFDTMLLLLRKLDKVSDHVTWSQRLPSFLNNKKIASKGW